MLGSLGCAGECGCGGGCDHSKSKEGIGMLAYGVQSYHPGIHGLGADVTFPWYSGDPTIDPLTQMDTQAYDPSLTQYSVDPPIAVNTSGHPLVGAAASGAFAAGVRVFENIFTPKPAYSQITGPKGSSTTVWGTPPSGVPGLNLSVPGGGLSITTMALIGVGLIGAFAMMRK